MTMPGALKRELILGGALLGFGVLLLPLAVYWVGREVIGPFESEAGLWGLLTQIWGDLAAGDVIAWTLVLAPYLVVQLLRLAGALWKVGRSVNRVTVPDDYQ